MAKNNYYFSVDERKHPNTKRFLDACKARHENVSDVICSAVDLIIKQRLYDQSLFRQVDELRKKRDDKEKLDRYFEFLDMESKLSYQELAARYNRGELEKIWHIAEKLKRNANTATDYLMQCERSGARKIHGYPGATRIQQHFRIDDDAQQQEEL